ADVLPDAAGVKAHVDARVTTSPTDTTAGRLLKVGDFGLGGVVDLRSTAIATGTPADIFGMGTIYGFSDGVTLGLPVSGYGTLEVSYPWTDGSATDSAYRKFTHLGGIFIQSAISVAQWGPWCKLYHTGNTTVDGNGFIKAAS